MGNQKIEDLKDKAEKSVLEKSPGMSRIPFGVTSFQEVDELQNAQEVMKNVSDVFMTYVDLAASILFDDVVATDKVVTSLKQLTNEFVARIGDTVDNSDFKSTKEVLYKSNTVTVYKENGVTRWLGVPSNKFMDRDNPPDILSEKAHKQFVDKLDKGICPMPDLFIWHIDKSVGKATWVDYDERGFLVAGGTVHKEYEDYVLSLLKNSNSEIGMSHGMDTRTIVRNKSLNHVIDEYESFEFSFLPVEEAANLLTTFGVETDG